MTTKPTTRCFLGLLPICIRGWICSCLFEYCGLNQRRVLCGNGSIVAREDSPTSIARASGRRASRGPGHLSLAMSLKCTVQAVKIPPTVRDGYGVIVRCACTFGGGLVMVVVERPRVEMVGLMRRCFRFCWGQVRTGGLAGWAAGGIKRMLVAGDAERRSLTDGVVPTSLAPALFSDPPLPSAPALCHLFVPPGSTPTMCSKKRGFSFSWCENSLRGSRAGIGIWKPTHQQARIALTCLSKFGPLPETTGSLRIRQLLHQALLTPPIIPPRLIFMQSLRCFESLHWLIHQTSLGDGLGMC